MQRSIPFHYSGAYRLRLEVTPHDDHSVMVKPWFSSESSRYTTSSADARRGSGNLAEVNGRGRGRGGIVIPGLEAVHVCRPPYIPTHD